MKPKCLVKHGSEPSDGSGLQRHSNSPEATDNQSLISKPLRLHPHTPLTDPKPLNSNIILRGTAQANRYSKRQKSTRMVLFFFFVSFFSEAMIRADSSHFHSKFPRCEAPAAAQMAPPVRVRSYLADFRGTAALRRWRRHTKRAQPVT